MPALTDEHTATNGRSWVLHWLLPPRRGTPQPRTRVREAVPGDAALSTAFPDRSEDRAFRPLSGLTAYRDLAPGDWRGLLLEAYEAYCSNPLAYAVIEMGVNFVVGGGVKVVAAEARVQREADDFWHDPENRMDERVPQLYTELSLYGEQFVRFFADPVTGRVVIRQVDPLAVVEIETDPDDVERPLRYRLATGAAERWVPAAEILHCAVNKVSNARRGRSDLATLLPWLRRYKDWLTDRVRINRYKAAFLYDVTVEGATAEELAKKRSEYAEPPEPGTVIFHNQAERWQAVHPAIAADDVAADGRAIKLMVAMGAGLPEHYLSDGSTTNRATAAEMGLPTVRRFRRRQELLRQVLVRIVSRALDERQRAGAIGPRTDRSFRVEFDELQEVDRRAAGQMAAMFANALATAEDRGWIDSAAARELFYRFLGEELRIND